MAKKPRTPPPPPRRPVQAPKPRTGGRDAADRRRFLFLVAFAAAGLAALGAVVLFLSLAGGSSGGDGSDDGIAATMEGAGCTFKSSPGQAREHITAPKQGFEYNSIPATSGPHHPQPVILGPYDAPVNDLQAIHNLEHGVVVLNYGNDVPQATVDQLTAFYRKDPVALLLAPHPGLGDKIALRAWFVDDQDVVKSDARGFGKLALCSSFDEGAFDAFVTAYRFKGPERVAARFLQPGM